MSRMLEILGKTQSAELKSSSRADKFSEILITAFEAPSRGGHHGTKTRVLVTFAWRSCPLALCRRELRPHRTLTP